MYIRTFLDDPCIPAGQPPKGSMTRLLSLLALNYAFVLALRGKDIAAFVAAIGAVGIHATRAKSSDCPKPEAPHA